MGKYSFTDKIKSWFLKILQIQLFISVISLPILISWGLPISLASPIGNILFTPILSLFLLLSSIVFFLELLCIPNEIFIYLLNVFTKLWLNLLELSSPAWLLTFPAISPIILIFIPLIALAALQHKKVNNQLKTIICFSLILLSIFFYAKLTHKIVNETKKHIIDGKEITIAAHNGKLSLIDYEILGKSPSLNSWLEYNLVSYLIQKFGHYNIENIILYEPNKRTIKAINFIINKIPVKHIYIVSNIKIDLDPELIAKLKDKNITLKHMENIYLTGFIAN